MEVIRAKTIVCGKKDIISIYPLGDIHAGTTHCAEKEIKDKVKEIKENPFAYWVGMGDLAEFITPSDKRWEPSICSIASWVEPDNIAESHRKWIVNLLSPIKTKCIGLILGNHEDSFRIHSHNNIHLNICNDLSVPNLGYSAFVHFSFARPKSTDRRVYKGVFTHGAGSSITRGGKLNRLEKFMTSFDGDFYCYAHMHDIITTSAPQMTTNKKLVIAEKKRLGAVTGCWYRTYTQGKPPSYGEKKGYAPTTLGCPVFKLRPFHDEIWVEGKGIK